jgi:hypothetical protein
VDIPLAQARLDRVGAALIVGYAVVLSAVVAGVSALLEGVALLVVLLVLVLLWLVHVGLYLYAWSRLRKVAFPLGLHGDGVHDRSPLNEHIVPWEAVGSVTLEDRVLRSPLLTVRPSDPATRRVRYSLRILDIDADELRRAFTVQSGGRVQVS